jgi:hypothetical protein
VQNIWQSWETSYHTDCSRTLDSNPRIGSLSSWTKIIPKLHILKDLTRTYSLLLLSLHPNCSKTHYFPNFSYYSSEIKRVCSSWNFTSYFSFSPGIAVEKWSADIRGMYSISDGYQVMVLARVRSSRTWLFTSVHMISKSLRLISDGDSWLC